MSSTIAKSLTSAQAALTRSMSQYIRDGRPSRDAIQLALLIWSFLIVSSVL
ncbi:MAG: hypothetical protein KDA58_14535 [Planctomycetaceae bacterium]|nr:hypothetical protein [Planctomycetaceae bacterium]